MTDKDATRRPQARFAAGELNSMAIPIEMLDEPAPEPATDPWIHRSEGMRCKSCLWFVPKKRTEPGLAMTVGRCRRHAPTMNGYPVVYITDWCGDHRIDENKI